MVGDTIVCFKEKSDQARYYDAQVIDIQRKLHDIRGCRCIFLVQYEHDKTEDVVSSPRPKSVLTVTEDEKENVMEYGLPYSHTLNTVCLSRYPAVYGLPVKHSKPAVNRSKVHGEAILAELILTEPVVRMLDPLRD
nr:protein SAWADEE homeodomain homolog 1-like [Tanacetum cinerariifolium]